jgi:RNA polymerase sigma factor (sigma-70 family)
MLEGCLISETPGPQELAEQGERRRIVNLVVLALPLRQAVLIRLRYGRPGLTMRQVGVAFGVSEAAVCRMEHRALVNLRTALGRLGVESFRDL